MRYNSNNRSATRKDIGSMTIRAASPSSLEDLKKLWKIESQHYRKSEVGSGVQSFVWDVFQNTDLFNLRRGLKATEAHKRKCEFLLEESNKNGQADAVIFVDAEVVIPVEVEKYENAQSGEWQILKYRTALDKSYGILTDGYEWRFYYGDIKDNQHYKFTIDDMLSKPKRFRTFWDEYVKPKNYYLSFFEQEMGQQKMEFCDRRLTVDDHRERFFDDVTGIIRKLKDKLLNAGYFRSFTDDKERDKKATEIAYSYLIQFILYKTLVDNTFGDFEKEFAKKSAIIHQNIKKESFNSILLILEGMSGTISENIYKPFHKEQEAILEQIKDIAHSGEDNIMHVAPFLDIFVFIKKYYFADVQNDIFGAIYENYLKELYEERQLGQYFTDPAVVNFMLEEIGYSASELKKRKHNNISIMDPSCGSGTFLYSAVREIVKARDYAKAEESKKIENDVLNNVFGLDIAEFPLYLAEMSILMKMLPTIVNKKYNNPIDKKLKLFVTEDSIGEFIEEIAGGTASDSDAQGHLALVWEYEGFMRDELDLEEMKSSLKTIGNAERTIPRRRFDFIIGNPPYIGYNECSKLNLKIFTMLQGKNSRVKLNNIYGWNLHSIPNNQKKYGPKPNLYAFFLALGFASLKENGRFCYIIPQTLLTAGDLDVVRHQLSKEYTIEKLYTFAANLFIGRGTNQKKRIPTSSLIIVCSKRKASNDHNVECVHLPSTGLDIKDVFPTLKAQRPSITKSIPQKKLRENVANWNFVQWDDSLLRLYEAYKRKSQSIELYYDHQKAQNEFGTRFYFDKGLVFPKNRIRDNSGGDFLLIRNSHSYHPELQDKSIDREFIQLPDGAQGFGLFDLQHKIIWSYMNPANFKFTSDNIMIDFNWVIIASDNKPELLYLFGLLNSTLIWTLLNCLLRLENEKSFSIGIKVVKEFVRVPIMSSVNRHLKDSIITLAESILELDKQTIGDLVEFDTLVQRVDDVWTEGSTLVLKKGLREIRATIKRGAAKVVESTAVRFNLGLPSSSPLLSVLYRDVRVSAI